MMVKKWLKRVGLFVCASVLSFGMQQSIKAETYSDISNSYEWEVLKLVNKERLADGEAALSMFGTLQSAADVRAKEIAISFSHTRPDGSSCFSIITQKGISCYTAGENIASGQRTPEEVMKGWMGSPGHRENMLNPAFHHIGIGYGATGVCGNSWVQLFSGGCTIAGLSVNKTSQTYPVGTSIEAMNRYLIIECSHGTAYAPVISSMCSGYKEGQSGNQTVTVTFQGNSVVIPVSIGESNTAEGNKSDSDISEKVKKPGKVVSLAGKKTSGTSYKLTWKKIKCDGYEVWRADSRNKKYKKIKTITSGSKNRYIVKLSSLKADRKYYYKVRTYNKDGKNRKYGAFSKVRTLKRE